MERCLGGYTQNSNESFNATVWNLAPKSYSSGKKILDLATAIGVCIFNDGLTSILHIMEALELDVGPRAYNFCIESDAKRVQADERSLTDAAKEARSSTKSVRKDLENEYSNLEGQVYGAGIAD